MLQWANFGTTIFEIIIMIIQASLPYRLGHEINKEIKTYLYRETNKMQKKNPNKNTIKAHRILIVVICVVTKEVSL